MNMPVPPASFVDDGDDTAEGREKKRKAGLPYLNLRAANAGEEIAPPVAAKFVVPDAVLAREPGVASADKAVSAGNAAALSDVAQADGKSGTNGDASLDPAVRESLEQGPKDADGYLTEAKPFGTDTGDGVDPDKLERSTPERPYTPNAAPFAGSGAAMSLGHAYSGALTTTVSPNGDPRVHNLSEVLHNHTLGVVNNNFGNIRTGSFTDSRGSIGANHGFAVFKTPEEGVRAANDLMDSYARKGWDSPLAIISHWAPLGDGNNTGAYAATVAKAMGLASVDSKIDMSDKHQRAVMLAAVFHVECGIDPFGPDRIAQILDNKSLSSDHTVDAPASKDAPSKGDGGKAEPPETPNGPPYNKDLKSKNGEAAPATPPATAAVKTAETVKPAPVGLSV